MTLDELLNEMPKYIDKEANFAGMMTRFFSERTLNSEFEFIFKGKDNTDSEFYVVMKKDHSQAVIGKPSIRKTDNQPGMEILGTAEFKERPDISSNSWINTGSNVLQIDSVEVAKAYKRQGYGFYLYLALAKAGYVVISDNIQYIGGKELWKKIASQFLNNEYDVFVIDDGLVVMKDGEPLKYDATNIDDADLWSSDNDKHFKLFVLKAK